MKKRVLCLLLALCMMIPMFTVPVSAADNPNDGYVYQAGTNLQPVWAKDDLSNPVSYMNTVTPVGGTEEKFSYEVPRNGAVVLLFFWTQCGVSQRFFDSLGDSPWLEDERLKFIAISGRTDDTADDVRRFRQSYAGDYMDQVEWYYNGFYTMAPYRDRAKSGGMTDSNVIYYPFVVVLTEEEYTEADGSKDLQNVIRFADMALQSATPLNNTLGWLFGDETAGEITLPADETWTVQVAGEKNFDMASEVARLVNEERAKNGQEPMEMNETLTAAAMQRAAECALYYSHDRPYYQIKDIPGLSDRLASCTTIFEEYDYTIRYEGGTNADSMGENIAAGQTSAAQVMNSWMNSTGHRANILSTNHTQIGVGCFTSNGTTYWVQTFSSNPEESAPTSPSGTENAVVSVKADTEFLDFDMKSTISLTSEESRGIQLVNRNSEFSSGSCILVPGESTNATAQDGTVIANVAKSADNLGLTVTAAADGTGTMTLKLAPEQTAPISISVKVAPAHVHSFSEWKVQTAATCTAEGKERRYCLCGEKEYRAIPTGGHTEEVIAGKAASCTETGLTEGKKCSVCDEILVAQQEIPMTPHNEAIYADGREATCTQNGVTEGKMCVDCGAVTQRPTTIPKTDHTEEVIPGKSATCTEVGFTEGKKCSVCGDVLVEQQEIPKLAHTEEVIPGKAATCAETGLTEGKKCSVCGEVLVEQQEISKLAHTEEVVSGKAATCTETGLTEGKKCSVCGEVLVVQQEIPKLAHTEEVVSAKDATCTEVGCTAGKKCSVCGLITEGCQEIPVVPHTEEVVPGKAATCTATGLTEGKKCSVCGTVITSQQEIPVTDHTWDGGAVVQAPSTTQTGLKKYTCTVCGGTKEEVIPVLTVCDGGAQCPLWRYTDVTPAHWAHHGMDYAINNGLMTGTEEGFTFSPDMAMSRAMLVTVLWRYSGSPDAPACNFTDVNPGEWFYKAVAWAASEGVVAGAGDGTFNPNGDVTREQLALILYQFAALMGIDNSARADLSAYPDAETVSFWAAEAVQWAVAEGIIAGATNDYNEVVLAPQTGANRAVVATIMMRFIQNVIGE